jgi:catechol 2,3-dioxygenase-like lactoylglutathione lyase family enzyme
MPFTLARLDHVVLNCTDVAATVAWYVRALGMVEEMFGPDRRMSLRWGEQKFNVRPTGATGWETARVDAPGSLDLCFITAAPIDEVVEHLNASGIEITKGPVEQHGALGLMDSVYCHDPDGNLVEVAVYRTDAGRRADHPA